ncbi:MAG: hypothetical protein LBN33_10120 [Desulfovibrio sp.]|nr:hypothetical protein [Desulfovibrio sp.]
MLRAFWGVNERISGKWAARRTKGKQCLTFKTCGEILELPQKISVE